MAVTATKYVVTVENSEVGAGNPAVVDFDINATGLDPTVVMAQVQAYFAGCESFSVGSSISSATYRPAAAAGAINVPDWTAAYTALRGSYSGLPAGLGPGVTFGSGAMTPAGTSIVVNEYTATPGRSYTGRHFLPYVKQGYVDSIGELYFSYATMVKGAYELFILCDGIIGAGYPLNPVVVSRKLTTQTLITDVTVSRSFGRLRSRQ